MKRLISFVLSTTALAMLSLSIAVAAPDDKGKAPKCETCKMELSAKKDKTHTVAVKVGKKTYYCCDKCPMGTKKKK